MKNEFILTHEGKEIFKGTETDCYMKLQRYQGHSAHWAMKYEGYKILELNPIFLKTWSKNDFNDAKKAIIDHFAGKTLKSHKGPVKFGSSYSSIDSILGLAYTSSSSIAMFGVCNIQLQFNEVYDYNHFAISENGHVFAELWDKNENVKLLQLTF
jgi:hypothetical protein